MTWWISGNGTLYQGDQRPGDRAATDSEVAKGTLFMLANAVVQAADVACMKIILQTVPRTAHQLGMLNAASFIAGGDTPPVADPPKTAFNALASAYGKSPTEFAKLVSVFASGAVALSVALRNLEVACMSPSNSADLATALAAFQTSINGLVATLNAAGPPVAIAPPDTILVAGVNA